MKRAYLALYANLGKRRRPAMYKVDGGCATVVVTYLWSLCDPQALKWNGSGQDWSDTGLRIAHRSGNPVNLTVRINNQNYAFMLCFSNNSHIFWHWKFHFFYAVFPSFAVFSCKFYSILHWALSTCSTPSKNSLFLKVQVLDRYPLSSQANLL